MSCWKTEGVALLSLMLTISACVSTSKVDEAAPTYKIPEPRYTLPVRVTQWIENQSSAFKSDHSRFQNGLKNQICNGVRSTWNPMYQVQLIIPKPRRGTPLDQADKQRQQYIQAARKYIKNELLLNVSFDSKRNIPQHNLGQIEVGRGYSLLPESVGAVVQYFSDVTMSEVTTEHEVSSIEPILIAVSNAKKLILAPKTPDASVTRYEGYRSGFFVETVGGGCQPASNDLPSLCVAVPNYILDFQLLRELYVLFMNEKQQTAVFKDPRGYMQYRGQSFFGETYAPMKQPEITVTGLLHDSDELWRAYFSRYLTVKESPDQNTNIINFDLTLGLDGFCQYGRPRVDLMAN